MNLDVAAVGATCADRFGLLRGTRRARLKRKSLLVSAPTGQMSTTFPEYGLSSVFPGARSMSQWSPRSKMPSSLVFGNLVEEARAARQRMQRSWSSMTCGPRSIALRLRTFSSSGKRLGLPVVVHVVVLELALTRLVADRTVDRVVDEQELEHGLLCAVFTRSFCVCTTMPSVTRVLQAICSFGTFSISTRHMRQLPAIVRPGMPAVVRDLDAEPLRGLDDGEAVFDLDLSAVDRRLRHGLSGRRPRRVAPRRAGGRDSGRARTCSSNSSRNLVTKLCAGIAAASASTQMVLPIMLSAMSSEQVDVRCAPGPRLEAAEHLVRASRCPRGRACTGRTTRGG